MDLSYDDQVRLYRAMVLARALAEHVATTQGKLSSRRGNEALAAGAALAVAAGDIIAPQRYDLGVYLVSGLSPEDLLAHRMVSGDMRARLIAPPSHDAGKALAVAAGMALSTQLRGEQRVTLAYTDSAGVESAEGYEALRFAALRHLPLVCVVEYPFMAPDDDAALLAYTSRLAAFGVATTCVDGGDALAVYAATCGAHDTARNGAGPVALVAQFAPMRAHSGYEREDRVGASADQRDPIARLADLLIARDVLTIEQRDQIVGEIADRVAIAVAASEERATAVTEIDTILFASPEASPLGPPLAPARVAAPVLSESREYRR